MQRATNIYDLDVLVQTFESEQAAEVGYQVVDARLKPGEDFAVLEIGDEAIGRVRTVDPDKAGFGVHHQSVIIKRGRRVGRMLLDYAIAYSDDDARSDLLDLGRKFDAHLAPVSSRPVRCAAAGASARLRWAR